MSHHRETARAAQAGISGDDRSSAAGWLRRRGFPFFVERAERGALVVGRTAPFLTLLVSVETAGWVLDRSVVSIDSAAPVVGLLLLALNAAALLALVGAPVAAFRLARGWLVSHPRGVTAAGWMLAVYEVAVAPWVAGHPEPVAAAVGAALKVALALCATRIGVGSLVSGALWSTARQLRALPQMTSRALPLLMLVVAVSFFSRALWEVGASLDTARLAGVTGLFALLGLLFIVPVARAEARELPNEGVPLSRVERANIVAVMILAQSAQVAIFACLVCAFLVALGQLAFTPALLDAWIGPSRERLELLGVQLPFDAVLVRTAAVLSSVSALNFVVSATSNAAYRSAFYDPLVDDVRGALLVRAADRRSGASEFWEKPE